MENLLKDTKLDIIIIAGQSNAEGFGVGEVSEEYVKDDRILWLNDKSNPHFTQDENGKDIFHISYPSEMYISVAEEPIKNEEGKVGKLSFFFAKEYLKEKLATDRKILIVNAAVGGTGFARNEWGYTENSVLFRRLMDMTKYALSLNSENRIVAFLWHQGECDSVETANIDTESKFKLHKSNLENMLNNFKTAFNCKDVPYIAGSFCDEWYLKNTEICEGILKAIKAVCEENGGFVETKGLLSNNQKCGNGDDIHFCRESSHILGKKYYEKYKSLVK